MGKPQPLDLRQRVVAHVEAGHTHHSAAARFTVSVKLVNDIAHDSGAMRGKRAIGGGPRLLRHVMFQAALVASHHNVILHTFAKRLHATGKPPKVVITAVARKLVTILNALVKSGQNWSAQTL